MSEKVTHGSCMCGEVKYEMRGELRPICLCHCTMCRKASGHFTAATSVPTDKLTVSGDSLVWFKSSDYAERAFCNKCGSSLFFRPFGRERTSVFVGSIDGETGLETKAQIWVEDKGDYYDLPDIPVIDQSDLKDDWGANVG